MKVLRAETMGFCFGVQDAIELAQEATQNEEKIYALGPLIHNQQVIDRLQHDGLTTVDSPEELGDAPVVIRAHGVPPSTMAAAKERSLSVIDATCVLVRRAQLAVAQLEEDGFDVIVVGDANHPEVRGIVGYAKSVRVISGIEEFHALPQAGRLGIVAQTTLPQEKFAEVVHQILLRPFREIKIVNTLCLEVLHRQEAARALCGKVDVMFVLGGRHSANTQELAALCESEGLTTHHLENWSDFRPEFAAGFRIAGVTAGASTPGWIIDEFVEQLEQFDSDC